MLANVGPQGLEILNNWKQQTPNWKGVAELPVEVSSGKAKAATPKAQKKSISLQSAQSREEQLREYRERHSLRKVTSKTGFASGGGEAPGDPVLAADLADVVVRSSESMLSREARRRRKLMRNLMRNQGLMDKAEGVELKSDTNHETAREKQPKDLQQTPKEWLC